MKAEGATDILSRSRKVRTQIPNKTNFVTARDDGAKGQRPQRGRAGAGLASPAGTGAGAAVFVKRREDLGLPDLLPEPSNRFGVVFGDNPTLDVVMKNLCCRAERFHSFDVSLL